MGTAVGWQWGDAACPPTRHQAIVAKAQEAAGLLQDNHELQSFLQSCREVGEQHSQWHCGVPPGPSRDTLSHSSPPGWRRRC